MHVRFHQPERKHHAPSSRAYAFALVIGTVRSPELRECSIVEEPADPATGASLSRLPSRQCCGSGPPA